MKRRTVLKAAAWAVPLTVLVTATPARAASGDVPPPALFCPPQNPGSGDVEWVRIEGLVLFIQTKSTARNAIDVTVRQAGTQTVHLNLMPPGSPNNGVPHERPYTPGELVTVALPVAFDLARDWFQVQAIHSTDCVVTS